MSIIIVENLRKTFADIVAVDDVTFQVERESIFGFLGPNGAGKTTTINILCTLMNPTSGRAYVNHYDCIRESHKVRESIGIVFQDMTLDRELTAYENLLFHAYLYRVKKSERKERVSDALRFSGLYERRNDLVKHFSGGMKRRLEVARAIVHQPKVLFLDEPTLGLDPQSRANLWEFITKLPEKSGVTIFMTTHYMDEAEVCQRIAIIDQGKIIAQGSPEELKKTIGGDVIYLKTKNNHDSVARIRETFHLEPVEKEGEFFISNVKGDVCIPELIRALGENVISVRLQRPTLNDVFLKMTGRAIRKEEGNSTPDIKEEIRAYRRRFDRG